MELLEDESGKPQVCGMTDFKMVEQACLDFEKMHCYEKKETELFVEPSLTQWSARDTYGLDSKLLEDLGISGPLYYRVAVSNVS
jgi:hypothetical protein